MRLFEVLTSSGLDMAAIDYGKLAAYEPGLSYGKTELGWRPVGGGAPLFRFVEDSMADLSTWDVWLKADAEAVLRLLLEGDDRIWGGHGPDRLFGYDGDDTIAPGELMGADNGADTAFGGAGDDTIMDGSGTNYLRGDEGDDEILGGDGFDDAHGGPGNDSVYGGYGGDWVVGGKGEDLLDGGHHSDVVLGNIGNDTCSGGEWDDIVRGGQGDDFLSGGANDDWLSGDLGADTVSGGSGADTFNIFAEAGLDRVLDFDRAQGDRVRVEGGASFGVDQTGADVVVSLSGGARMVLVGVQLSSLSDGWIFAA